MRQTRAQQAATAAIFLVVLAGLGALLWLTVFAGGGHEEDRSAEVGTAAGEQPATAPAAVGPPLAVTIQDFKYTPSPATVPVGGGVTWTQRDIIAHTVTSGTRGAANAGQLFDQTLSAVGSTFTFQFGQAGAFPYFCRFHTDMNGEVDAGQPAAQATPSPSPTPPAFATVPSTAVQPPPPGATLVAGQLLNPRGFTWGPDGALYVAEAGTPQPLNLPGTQSAEARATLLFCEGWNHTAGAPPQNCPQQPAQRVRTGRISRIASDGRRSTVVDGLPVIAGMFGFTEGPASVAFIGNDLYVLITAEDIQGDIRPGQPDVLPTGVYRVNPNGTGMLVANIYQWNVSNPPSVIPPDWGDGEPYDMVALNNKLYVSDGNASVIHEVDPAAPATSRIRTYADLSPLDGTHPVTTGLAIGPDNALYVTNLTKAPYPQGGAKVWRIAGPGQITQVASGFTLGVGLAIDTAGAFYVAEFARIAADQDPPIVPGGRLLRALPGQPPATLLENLFYPTIIRRGPDNMLYLTYFSIGADNGQAPGAIYRFNPAGR